MSAPEGLDVVTGAFSYSGAAIARELERLGISARWISAQSGEGVRELLSMLARDLAASRAAESAAADAAEVAETLEP